MNKNSEDSLEKFLEKILSRNGDDSETSIDEEQLKQLALKYGLTESQWDEISVEACEGKKRGMLFLEADNIDEAIREFEQAKVILPYDTDLQFHLASAYARRFENHRRDADAEIADSLFRGCIDRNPDHVEAIRQLTRLSRLRKSGSLPRRAVVMGLLLAGFAVVVIYGIRSLGGRTGEGPPPPIVEAPTDIPPASSLAGQVDIPVNFPVADLSDSYSFELRSSVLSRFATGSFSYELKGTVLPLTVEIESMKAEVELIGEGEKVLARGKFDIVPDFRSGALPGDSVPFRILVFEEFTAPSISEARILVTHSEEVPFEGEPEPGKLLEWEGEDALPANYGIRVHERNAVRSDGGLLDKENALLKLVLTIENTGKQQIRTLEFGAEVVDSNGEVLPLAHSSIMKNFSSKREAGTFSIVSTVNPSLLPGERRVAEASIYVRDAEPGDLSSYRLRLIRVE